MSRLIHKLPWVLLAVSLVFNLSFSGGFLQARSAWPPQAEATETTEVARQLDLSEGQRKTFADLRRDWKDGSEPLRQAIDLTRHELWALMEDPATDEQTLQAAKQRLGELHDEFQQLRVEHFRRFMDSLRPQQRSRVIGRFRGRRRADKVHRRVLERFDADGDGVLSPAERRTAREHFQLQRRRPPRGPRPARRPNPEPNQYDTP